MSAPTRPRRRGNRPRVALVLSGGGARGAYEAGVLRYLREDLAGDLGGQVVFDIISGTSVGGIHACFVAGMAHLAAQQGRLLAERWESFVLENLLSFGVRDFVHLPSSLLGKEDEIDGHKRLRGVIETRQLENVVRHLIPWAQIALNRQRGLFESLSVSATDIGSGKTVVFVDSARELEKRRWSIDPFVRAQKVRMSAEHALASAAVPILFPAMAVGERFYCDGGLRQNTPISPALRLGADKVLVIGLRHPTKPAPPDAPPEEAMPFPGTAFLAGKILDSFLLDHVDYDLDRLRRFNALIRAVRETGTDAGKRFDEATIRMRGSPYREVGEMLVRPSENLGAIAGDIVRSGRFSGQGGGPGIRLLRRIATERGPSESDLLSYILFDGSYASELIRLGREDARAQHEALCRFLGDSIDRDDSIAAG